MTEHATDAEEHPISAACELVGRYLSIHLGLAALPANVKVAHVRPAKREKVTARKTSPGGKLERARRARLHLRHNRFNLKIFPDDFGKIRARKDRRM